MFGRKQLVGFGTVRTDIDYWPSYVDILTIVLMVFILQSFLQTFIDPDLLKMLRLRQTQEQLQSMLQAEFREEERAGKVTFAPGTNLLQIRFSEEILFAKGKYDLQSQGVHVLQRCAGVLRQVDAAMFHQIQIEGHTDSDAMRSTIYPHDNWELSAARALTVVKQMIADGIRPEKLSANGYGEFNWVVDNANQERRHLNRRIELRIMFSVPKENAGVAE